MDEITCERSRHRSRTELFISTAVVNLPLRSGNLAATDFFFVAPHAFLVRLLPLLLLLDVAPGCQVGARSSMPRVCLRRVTGAVALRSGCARIHFLLRPDSRSGRIDPTLAAARQAWTASL